MKVTDLKIGDKVRACRYFTGEVIAISKFGVKVKIDGGMKGFDTYTCMADDLELIKPDNL